MPISPQQVERIKGLLWPDEEHAAFALLDGAGIPNLLDKLYDDGGPEFACLYSGELAPDIAEVAPYIARLEPGTPFLDWVLSGWDRHWGIFAVLPAKVELGTLRRHFRKLNIVYGPDGNPLLFRYYDPRVLGSFLPSCDAEHLAAMFGPISRFVLEGDQPDGGRVLSLANGELVQETLALK